MVQGSRHAQLLQEEAVRQVETRRRMRQTVVPVIDADVRSTLRQLGEPITLFGEREVGEQLTSLNVSITICAVPSLWAPERCGCLADGEEDSAEKDPGRDG